MRENDGLQCSVVRFCKICKTCFHLEVPHTKTSKKMCWLRLQILVKGSCCIVLFTSYSFPFSVRLDLSNRCLHVWDHLENHFAWQFNNLRDTRITYMYLTVALLWQKHYFSAPRFAPWWKNKLKRYQLGLQNTYKTCTFFYFC